MRTSLVDITGESRTLKVPSGWWFGGPIAEHRQATSIGGLLQVPDVGQEFNFAGIDDVTTAVGVAVLQSYKLVGTADVVDGPAKVGRVRDLLEESQAHALRATLLTADLERAIPLLSSYSGASADVQRARIEEIRADLRGAEASLLDSQAKLRVAANAPGIIVAQWNAASSSSIVAGAPGASLRSMSGDSRAGFFVIGGLRIASVVFGEDFWWLINNLREHERSYVDQIGVTTYCLQARDIAYSSNLLLSQSVQAAFEKIVPSLDPVSQAKVSGYWSFLGQYSNSGRLDRVTWSREPFCFACSLDLPELAEPQDRAVDQALRISGKPGSSASYQGWRTISATITSLRDIPLLFSWAEHAAEYKAPRLFRGSPTCPRCANCEGIITHIHQ